MPVLCSYKCSSEHTQLINRHRKRLRIFRAKSYRENGGQRSIKSPVKEITQPSWTQSYKDVDISSHLRGKGRMSFNNRENYENRRHENV